MAILLSGLAKNIRANPVARLQNKDTLCANIVHRHGDFFMLLGLSFIWDLLTINLSLFILWNSVSTLSTMEYQEGDKKGGNIPSSL